MLCYARALTQYYGVVPRLQKTGKKKKERKEKKRNTTTPEVRPTLRSLADFATKPLAVEDTIQSSSIKSRPHTKARMARRSGEPEISFFGWWIIAPTANQ